MTPKKYISLKEASTLSGYSADYVGQLIRQGKIHGKKIYSNVSWVTTEDSINEYLKELSGVKSVGSQFISKSVQAGRKVVISFDPFVAFKLLRNFAVFTLIIVSLFVFYVLSIAIDNKIEQKALQSFNFRKIVLEGN